MTASHIVYARERRRLRINGIWGRLATWVRQLPEQDFCAHVRDEWRDTWPNLSAPSDSEILECRACQELGIPF